MWVAPPARGQGLGAALVGAAADWAAEQGADRLVARVFDDNEPATTVYARLGFLRDGEPVLSRRHPPRTWHVWVHRLARG